jgi:hypothetical protein
MNSEPTLNSCGGCEGPVAPTPASLFNAPGLPALAYRVGTHGRFNAAFHLGLATDPSLRALATRDSADPSIALLDAWAAVLDVLTFYQERIANEGFLRTATERRSILELARAIGYELRPGVAAGTCLAFTLDNAPGAPASVKLAVGTKAQSVPEQDERPQLFETVEEIEARPEWNELRPQRHVPSLPLQLGHKQVYLQGTATGLKLGDALLFIGDERKHDARNENWDFRRVARVELVQLPPSAGPNAGYTVVTLDHGLGSFVPEVQPTQRNPEVYALRQRAAVFGYNAVDWKALPDITKLAYLGRPPTGTLTEAERAEWPRFTVFFAAGGRANPSPAILPIRASAPAEATARDVFATAQTAAVKAADQLDQRARASALCSAQSAAAGVMGLVQSAAAVVGDLHESTAAHTSGLPSAIQALVGAMLHIFKPRALDSLKTSLDNSLPNLDTLKSQAGSLSFNPASLYQVGDGMNALKELLNSFAIFLKSPLVEFDLAPARLTALVAALEGFLRLVDPLRVSLQSLTAVKVRTAFSAAQSAAEEAMRASRESAGAVAAAAVAREAQLLIIAAMQAALDGVIPAPVGHSARQHVADVGRSAARLAVTAAAAQNEAALLGAVGATINPVLALGVYAASKLTQDAQSSAAAQVRDAVLTAIETVLSTTGHTAEALPSSGVPTPIAGATVAGCQFDLDAVYPQLVAGKGWLVLSAPQYQEVFRIDAAVESARAEFGLSGKTTRITLGAGENLDRFDQAVRTLVVHAGSERLEFADQPRPDPIAGGEIVLAPAADGLKPGRWLSVSGLEVATGRPASEVVEILTVETSGDATRVVLTKKLSGTYQRDTVKINANVARATHGETKPDEVLGSGDGSLPFQRFTLKQKPLTFVSAPVPGGAASTLEVRVKGVRWQEVGSFHGVGRSERAFLTRRADDGTVTLQFGDGATGARLPSGVNNVTATYRVGIGLAGNVKPGAITTLLSRPLGAKAVVNPIPASGAGAAEQLQDARTNAPLTVLTLDRIVSVQDFEDFARAFAGIGKAQARLLWSGERQIVHLTVAAADGSALDPKSEFFQNFLAGIDAARHADQPVRVSPHTPLGFSVSARVAVKADRIKAEVLAALKLALSQAFAFGLRAFGQGATSSEVLAVMQRVPGVVAVDLDLLNGLDPNTHPNIPARVAQWDGNDIHGAELLLLAPDGITLTDLLL